MRLKQVTLFASMSDEQLANLEHHSRSLKFAKGEHVLVAGDMGRRLYVVLSGRVRVYRCGVDGHEHTLNFLAPGDYFGELALLGPGAPRSASAIAFEESVVLGIEREAFLASLANCPLASSVLMQKLVGYVTDLTDEVHSLALETVYERLRKLLYRLGGDAEGQHEVNGYSHNDLAAMAGASREMITRILNDLRTGGYVETSRRRIRIAKKLPMAW